MKKYIYIIIALTTIAVSSIIVIIFVNKGIPDTNELESVKEISIDKEANRVSGVSDLEKYDHLIEQPINIIGTLKKIKNNDNNSYTLILSSEDKKLNIICKMQNDQINKINSLTVGQNINIKGVYKGYLIDMILLNCIII